MWAIINHKSIKKIYEILLVFVLVMSVNKELKAQSIYFSYIDGSYNSYNLKDVSKITFNENEMNLHLTEGTTHSWNYSIIKNYRYNQSSVGLKEPNIASNFEISLFPNPTSKDLNVRFYISKDDLISISLYDLQGKERMFKNIGIQLAGEHHEIFDLNSLKLGTYFCQIKGLHQSVTRKIIIN